MQDDYKASKEAFVSHQSGSTVTHINLISSVALSSIALHSALRSRLLQNNGSNLAAEFILLILPLLLSMTVFVNEPVFLDTILIIPTILLLLVPARSQQSPPSPLQTSRPPSPTHLMNDSSNSNEVGYPRIIVTPLPALTTYRTHMLVMTFLGILAVDFPVFPRALAKCETFGVSLMDMGVGSFVFSQGIVSSIPLLKNPSHISAPMLPKLTTLFRKLLPLIFLGVLRVILVKGVEYPEHESEYGTHWNFFITMAALPLLEVFFHPLLPHSGILSVGVGITLLHQFALSNTFLQDWTLTAPRANVISQNKEGLVSLPGYLAIHVLGLLTGTILLPPSPSDFRRLQHRIRRDESDVSSPPNPSKSRSRQNVKTATELCSYAVVWWTLFVLGNLLGLGGGVSRRLANAPYVLWVVAYNTSFITAYLALDSIFFSHASGRTLSRTSSNVLSSTSVGRVEPPAETSVSGSQPPRQAAMLLEAINLNGLPLFLLANVATGLVNMTVRTMYASDIKAMVILSLYAFGLSAVAWVTRERRLWKM